MRRPFAVVTVVVIACTLGLTGCGQSQVEQPASLVPMEDFFRNPEQYAFELSPDGEHMAFLAPWESSVSCPATPNS